MFPPSDRNGLFQVIQVKRFLSLVVFMVWKLEITPELLNVYLLNPGVASSQPVCVL